MEKQILNQPNRRRPSGYSHLVKVKGETTIFLAGQVAEDIQGKLVGKDDICLQYDKILFNIQETLGTAGAGLTNIVKMTIYCPEREKYMSKLKEIGAIYLKYFGKYFPAMTFVEVKGLFSPDYLLEVDAIAVL